MTTYTSGGISMTFSSVGNAELPEVLAAKLDKLAFQLKSFRMPLHYAVATVLAPSIKQNFETSSADGVRWERLKPSTVKRKRRYSYPSKPLIRTGKLEKVASKIARWTITATTASFSLPKGFEYGYYHQSGFMHVVNKNSFKPSLSVDIFGGRPKNVPTFVPARPFAVLGAVERASVMIVMNDWIDERIARVRKK